MVRPAVKHCRKSLSVLKDLSSHCIDAGLHIFGFRVSPIYVHKSLLWLSDYYDDDADDDNDKACLSMRALTSFESSFSKISQKPEEASNL